jgi:macrolide-specific efflux system membrane fusion protein
MKLKLFVIALLVAVGAVAVFVSLGGALPLSGDAAASEYLTATATTGDVTDEVAATGAVTAAQTYGLGFGAAPQVITDDTAQVGSGTWTVTSVDAQVGQSVTKGDVLATAATDDLQDQLVAARSSLAAAGLELKMARVNFDDASGTTARRQAKVALYNARNARLQARRDVTDLEEQIELATLRAPIDGIVTTLDLVEGLESTGTALTVASTAYEVTADVVEDDISSMSVGQAATVSVDAIGAVIDGRVTAIGPSAGSATGDVVSFPVTITLTGTPPAVRSGMTADITIVTASATDVLTVPAEALRGTSGDYRVLVVGPDGTPTPTPVTVGLVTSTLAEIQSGLSEGDVVVTGTASSRTSVDGVTTRGFEGGGVVIEGGSGPGVFPRP